MFQSTHPHGVRLVRQIVIMTYESVSIHAPTRGATLHGSVLRRGIRVSIHAPTRGATMLINPTSEFDRVSIHAPTRGATIITMFVLVVSDVSIHAPTRGATRPSPLSYTGFPCFNPRTHTGCDFPHVHVFPYLVVSIHAPTRGATNPRDDQLQRVRVSIHAPTRGATSSRIASC